MDKTPHGYKYYKNTYLQLKSDQKGGADNIDNDKIKKVKKVLYYNGVLNVENTIDDDILDMNSCFAIGSITKIFTIFVILILHGKGIININDTMIKYIKTKNKNNKQKLKLVKIIDVINHVSGLKRYAK